MKAEIQRALNDLYHNGSIDVELLNKVVSYIELIEHTTIPIEFIEHRISHYNDWHEDTEPLIQLIRDYMDGKE